MEYNTNRTVYSTNIHHITPTFKFGVFREFSIYISKDNICCAVTGDPWDVYWQYFSLTALGYISDSTINRCGAGMIDKQEIYLKS